MKIRMLNSRAGNADERYGLDDFSFGVGQVVDVHKTLAAAWIESGDAEKAKASAQDALAAETTTVQEGA